MVENANVGIESGLDRALAKDGCGEGVNRLERGEVEIAQGGQFPNRGQLGADTVAQLSGSLLGEGDGDDLGRSDPAAHEVDDP